MPMTPATKIEAPFYGINQRLDSRLMDPHWAVDAQNVTCSDGDIRRRPGTTVMIPSGAKLWGFLQVLWKDIQVSAIHTHWESESLRKTYFAVTYHLQDDSNPDDPFQGQFRHTIFWYDASVTDGLVQLNNVPYMGSADTETVQFISEGGKLYFHHPTTQIPADPLRVVVPDAGPGHIEVVDEIPREDIHANAGSYSGFLQGELMRAHVFPQIDGDDLPDGEGVPGDSQGLEEAPLIWYATTIRNVLTGQETLPAFTPIAPNNSEYIQGDGEPLGSNGKLGNSTYKIIMFLSTAKASAEQMYDAGWQQIGVYRKNEVAGDIYFSFVKYFDCVRPDSRIDGTTWMRNTETYGLFCSDDIPDINRDPYTLAPIRNGAPVKGDDTGILSIGGGAMVSHGGRLWKAKIGKLYWSHLNNEVEWEPSDWIAVGNVNDPIHFLQVLDGRIIIGKTSEIWSLAGDPPLLTAESVAQYLGGDLAAQELAANTLELTIVDSSTGFPARKTPDGAIIRDGILYFVSEDGLYTTQGSTAVRLSNAFPRGFAVGNAALGLVGHTRIAIDEKLGLLIVGLWRSTEDPFDEFDTILALSIRGTPTQIAEAGWYIWAPPAEWTGWYGPFQWTDANGVLRAAIIMGGYRQSIDIGFFDIDAEDDFGPNNSDGTGTLGPYGIPWFWKTGQINNAAGDFRKRLDQFRLEHNGKIGNLTVNYTASIENRTEQWSDTVVLDSSGFSETPIGLRLRDLQIELTNVDSEGVLADLDGRIRSFGFYSEPLGHR